MGWHFSNADTSSATHSIKTTSSILLLVLHTNLPTIKKSLDAPVVIGISARQPHRTLPTSQRSRHRVSSAPPQIPFRSPALHLHTNPLGQIPSLANPPMRFGNAYAPGVFFEISKSPAGCCATSDGYSRRLSVTSAKKLPEGWSE
jgi:hypothetical protein